MKEFTFSKRNASLILLIILLTGAGIILIQQFSRQPSGEVATPSLEEAEITNAAVVGTRAFFQISVNEGKDAWLNRFCAARTSASAQEGSVIVLDVPTQQIEVTPGLKVDPPTLLAVLDKYGAIHLALQSTKGLNLDVSDVLTLNLGELYEEMNDYRKKD